VRGVGGVWLRAERTQRTSPALTRDRITAAAVTLLDADGVAGLTMRRLAERLDTGPASLYWHVSTKDDVVDLALDAIFAEVPLPERPHPDWRHEIRELVGAWRATMLRHPWSAALLGRPLLGPQVLARTEHLQAVLQRAGLVEPDLTAATHAVANYVIGSALTQSTWRGLDDPAARQAARDRLAPYPTLTASGHLDDRDPDDMFGRGLAYLLDGVATRTGG
jgi:AcrR family transcriptional regulator